MFPRIGAGKQSGNRRRLEAKTPPVVARIKPNRATHGLHDRPTSTRTNAPRRRSGPHSSRLRPYAAQSAHSARQTGRVTRTVAGHARRQRSCCIADLLKLVISQGDHSVRCGSVRSVRERIASGCAGSVGAGPVRPISETCAFARRSLDSPLGITLVFLLY